MLIIIKPTHNCNLRCSYCYVSNNLKGSSAKLNIDFTKKIVKQIKDYAIKKRIYNINFLWHGGEPLLWGYDNYNKIFYYTKKIFSKTKIKIHHSIQTNLTLINEKMISLFKDFNVSIGFSIDGYGKLNDYTRVYSNNKGTFNTLIKKIELCKKFNLKISAIVVANSKNINELSKIYSFFNKLNINFKVNPIFKHGEATNNFKEIGITPEEYSMNMIKLFDEWTANKDNNIDMPFFSEIASNLVTKKPTLCNFRKNCQDNIFSISPEGYIYPCGRFDGDTKFNFGNLHNENLKDILDKKEIYFKNKREEFLISNDCKNCKYFSICHGGCMHDAYINDGNLMQKTNLCYAYKSLFEHINNFLISNNILTNFKSLNYGK